MVRSSVILLAVTTVAAAILLQGCGGSAEATTKAPGPAATTTAAAAGTTTAAGPTATTIAAATTTTTEHADCVVAAGKLPNCLCKPNFIAGPCTAQSPGGCFAASGKESEKDKGWMCWGDDRAAEDRTDAKCKTDGYGGACEITGHVTTYASESEIPSCEAKATFKSQCNPPQNHWGACFTSDDHPWLCVGKDESEDAKAKWMKGACDTQSQELTDPNVGFPGVCKFSDTPQTVYKCETVKSFVASEISSAWPTETPPVDSACFILKAGPVKWQWSPGTTLNQNCVTQPLTGDGGDTWDGACILKGASGYDAAADWKEPTGAVEIV